MRGQRRLVNVRRPDRAGRLRVGGGKMTTKVLSACGDRAVRLGQMAVGIVPVCAAASRGDRRMSIHAGSNSVQRDEKQRGHDRYYPHESEAQCVQLFHDGLLSSCRTDLY